jgi:hypothetical protein
MAEPGTMAESVGRAKSHEEGRLGATPRVKLEPDQGHLLGSRGWGCLATLLSEVSELLWNTLL